MPSFRTVCSVFAFAFALVASGGANAQPSAADAAPVTSAPPEARQFDFLVGEWELEVKPKVSGLAAMIHGTPKLAGTMKAWREFDGFGVEDELRIYDASGNPVSLNRALRTWDRDEQRWTIVSLDVYRSRVTTSIAHRQQDEMLSSGSGVDHEGKPYLARTRYLEIAPDHFRMQQDHSYDNGASWDEATLVIEARRTAAAAPAH